MGVVHHSVYLVYFEEARSHYMRELGRDYASIEAAGLRLPVTEAGLRCNAALRYGQRVRVRLWIEENRSRRVKFRYEVSAAGGTAAKDGGDGAPVLATGYTCHVWTDETGRVTRIPESLKQLLDGDNKQ